MDLNGKRVKKNSPTSNPENKYEKMLIAKPDIMHGYLHHAEINKYMEYLGYRYPNFVKVHTLGMTYEHRTLKAIEIDWCCPKNLVHMANNPALHKVSLNVKGKKTSATNHVINLPVNRRNFVFIEGGTHAREWISISVALNCIYQLTEKNLRHRDLLTKLRFFIVPVVNPDGYEYTQKKNRRWRKNRRPIENTKSIGTDCNRNYDFHWEKGPSKAHRCTYKGDKPFSEPETQALRNVLETLAPHLLFFLSLHSYAQSIMYPWGFSKDLPDDWPNLQKLAMTGRNAIKKQTGRNYRCGSIAKVTKRLITGSIVDYAFGFVKVPLALVMELPSAEFGFQPPAEQIQAIGNESWVGIREMCKCAFDLAPEVAPKLSESTEILMKDKRKHKSHHKGAGDMESIKVIITEAAVASGRAGAQTPCENKADAET